MVISKHVSSFENRTILVKDIYGESVEIPKGYEYVGFRIPKLKERFLPHYFLRNTSYIGKCTNEEYFKNKPRIIVKQISQIKETPMTPYKKCFSKTWTIKEIYGVEDPVIPEGYEVTEFRIPNINEYYRSVRHPEAPQIFIIKSQTGLEPRLILRKQKKLYAKIPLTDLVLYPNFISVHFKSKDGHSRQADVSKDIEIVEE